jgi:hypothetical protein
MPLRIGALVAAWADLGDKRTPLAVEVILTNPGLDGDLGCVPGGPSGGDTHSGFLRSSVKRAIAAVVFLGVVRE